jgi:hypothetical protein
MADSIIKILTKATTFDLMTLDELKLKLGISDTSQDDVLSNMITEYSDVISARTNRVFGREKVLETWRCLGSRRVYLSHWPVTEGDIERVECPRGSTVSTVDYELEEQSGKLSLFVDVQQPVAVTYTGGFDLPDDAPPALQAALELLIRAARAQAQQQATSGVRSISHKDARVMFFDPNQALRATSGGTALTATGQSVESLLYHYTRFWV